MHKSANVNLFAHCVHNDKGMMNVRYTTCEKIHKRERERERREGRRKEGRKGGREGGRKEGRKEGRGRERERERQTKRWKETRLSSIVCGSHMTETTSYRACQQYRLSMK